MGAICDPANWTSTALGQPTGCIEIKLVDCPSLSYLSSHTPNPQGEIWIRGPAVTSGYLSLPEENAAAFTPDGWFKTGDIGEFADADTHGTGGGLLRVIDRKKNMVKTLNGEYIALEKLESIYRSCALVANICVVAAEDRNKPVAIVVPVEAAFKSLAEQNGVEGETIQDLAASEKLRELALRAIQEEGRRGGLNGIEIVENIVLAREEWTPQNVSFVPFLFHLPLLAFISEQRWEGKRTVWANRDMCVLGFRHQRAKGQPESHPPGIPDRRRQRVRSKRVSRWLSALWRSACPFPNYLRIYDDDDRTIMQATGQQAREIFETLHGGSSLLCEYLTSRAKTHRFHLDTDRTDTGAQGPDCHVSISVLPCNTPFPHTASSHIAIPCFHGASQLPVCGSAVRAMY